MKKAPLLLTSSEAKPFRKEEVTPLSVALLPQLIDSYLMVCEISQHSEKTIANRRGYLNRFLWFLQTKNYSQADVNAVRAFLLYLTSGHKEPGGRWGIANENKPNKPGTVKTYYIHLKTFFNWLITEGELEATPFARIPPPIDRPDQIQPFTAEQVQALIAAAKRSRNSIRDTALLFLMLDTGLRASEVCDLSIPDVNLTGCQLMVREGKGGKGRMVPFSPDVKRALWNYLRERGIQDYSEDAPLFLAGRGANAGGEISRSGLQQLFDRLAKAGKVDGVRCSPHTMRHTFAIEFLRAGGNVFTLKTMLGHESLAMTNRYVALAAADVTRQHAQFSPVARMKAKRNNPLPKKGI